MTEITDYPKPQGVQDLDIINIPQSKEKKESPDFNALYDLVDSRYSNEFKGNPEKLEKYKAHYREVVGNAKDIGEKMGLSEVELAKLEVATILHDLTKGDPAPDDVPDNAKAMYWLTAHGMTAANEIRSSVASEENNEIKAAIQKIVDMDPDNLTLESVTGEVADAIEKHMGPHPGFMTGQLDAMNAKLPDQMQLSHPRPGEEDKIAQILLAADMQSLAGPEGVKKVMKDIETIDFFRNNGKKTVEDFAKYGIDLTEGQAAFLSAYQSATQARDMVAPYGKVAESLDTAVETTENYDEFVFEGENISPSDAIALKEKFERHKFADEVMLPNPVDKAGEIL